MTSPTALYLHSLHPDLPLQAARAMTRRTPGVLLETITTLLPGTTEESALGIVDQISALMKEEGCGCQFFLDVGLTPEHVLASLVEVEAELLELEERPGVPARELATGILNVLLGRAPMTEELKAAKEAALQEVVLTERRDILEEALKHVLGAARCVRRKARMKAESVPAPDQPDAA